MPEFAKPAGNMLRSSVILCESEYLTKMHMSTQVVPVAVMRNVLRIYQAIMTHYERPQICFDACS